MLYLIAKSDIRLESSMTSHVTVTHCHTLVTGHMITYHRRT